MITLTEPDKECIEKGSPDIQILKELKQNGNQTKIDKLGKSVMEFGFNLAMKAKYIIYDKKSDNFTLTLAELPAKDEVKRKYNSNVQSSKSK